MSYSLWLSPEHRQTRRLKRKIAQLTQQCHSDSSEPHLTSSSGTAGKLRSQALQRLTRRPKQSLAALTVQHSSNQLQNIRLALRRDRELKALRIDTLRSFDKKKQLAAQPPQLSLLHAQLSAAKRAELARRIPVQLLSQNHGSKLHVIFTEGQQKKQISAEQQQIGLKP